MTVTGEVSGTWSVDTVLVTGDLLVPTGETLDISPGVQVRFTGPYKMLIQGTLSAVGNPLDSILFTRNRPSEEDKWRGLRFDGAENSSILQYCRLEWAKGTGSSPDVRGGAVWINNCSPTISHCLIFNNYSHNESFNGAGGGVCLSANSDAVIEYCTIKLNQSDSGGGICVGAGSHGTIRYSHIESNLACYAGGGIYVAAGAEASIYGNVIRSNSASGYGGGGLNLWSATWLYGTTSDVYDNLIAHNSATDAGGGIYSRYDASRMRDNTIISNTSARGAGLYVLTFPDLPPIIFNSVFWGNLAVEGPQILLDPSMGSTATISYCNVSGGWDGQGIINQYPEFVDTTYNDFRMGWNSPCIDEGDPELAYFDPDSTRADIGMGYFDQTSPVRILLTPHLTSIALLPTGGSFDFTIRAVNITDLSQPVTLWCNLIMPNGEISAPVLGPVQFTLPPSVTISRVRTQFVTGDSPTGVYYFRGFAVAGTDTSMDSFMFVKERDENHGAASFSGFSGVVGWVNSGEEFTTLVNPPGSSDNLAGSFVLHGASPNPFNSTTVIRFSLQQAAKVKLEVFDTSGRNVSTLSTTGSGLELQPGMHEINIDGSRLTSGVYLYRITAGGSIAANKLVLVK